MTTILNASEDLASFIRDRTAIIDPTYAAFMASGRPANEWLAYQDRVERPTDDLGVKGLTWSVEQFTSSMFIIKRKRAPYDEDRYEFTPSGQNKTYKTFAAAQKAAIKKNK